MSVRIYYKSTEGNTSVAPNFKVQEFACKDGCDIVPIDSELVSVLQRARDEFKAAVTIHSGYRTMGYNYKVGGAASSQHLRGTAADISIAGVSPDKVYKYFCEKYPNKYGIGKYNTFTHIDVRSVMSRWTGNN